MHKLNNTGAIQPFELTGENPLIETMQTEKGDIIVNGRELHEFLEVKTNYTTWFERMTEYGFAEKIDYELLSNFEKRTGSGGHNKIDHHIKLDMAKEIAMIQRNEKGKQARRYFLKIEKLWNSPEMVMKRAMDIANYRIAELTNENSELIQEIVEQKPKVIFAESVETSKSSILIGELAKLLKQNGIVIGQNRLFKWMRDNGYLIRREGEMFNTPTQYAMECEWFEIKKRTVTNPDGSVRVTRTPKVTGKGQIYFVNKFTRMKGGGSWEETN